MLPRIHNTYWLKGALLDFGSERNHESKVKGPDIYILLLNGKSEQQWFIIGSGVLTSISSSQRSANSTCETTQQSIAASEGRNQRYDRAMPLHRTATVVNVAATVTVV